MPSNNRTPASGQSEPVTNAPFTDDLPTGTERPSGPSSNGRPPAKKSNVMTIVVIVLVLFGIVGIWGYLKMAHRPVVRPRPSDPVATAPAQPSTVASPDKGEALLMGTPATATTTSAPASALTAAPVIAPASALTAAPIAAPVNGAPAVASTAAPATGPALPVPASSATPAPVGAVLAPNPAPNTEVNAALQAPALQAPAPAGSVTPASPTIVPPVNTLPVNPTPIHPTQVPASPVATAPVAPTPIGPVTSPATVAPIVPAPTTQAPAVDPVLQGRVQALEMRMQNLEDGQAKILQLLKAGKGDKAATVAPVKASSAGSVNKPPVHRASSPKASHNHVELIQPKPVAVAPVKATPSSCKLASIVPSRAWIKQTDGSFLTYGVGDEAPNGSTIKSIDPDTGIMTERGKLACTQGE